MLGGVYRRYLGPMPHNESLFISEALTLADTGEFDVSAIFEELQCRWENARDYWEADVISCLRQRCEMARDHRRCGFHHFVELEACPSENPVGTSIGPQDGNIRRIGKGAVVRMTEAQLSQLFDELYRGGSRDDWDYEDVHRAHLLYSRHEVWARRLGEDGEPGAWTLLPSAADSA